MILPQEMPHLARHASMQFRNAVAAFRVAQCQHAHAEGFAGRHVMARNIKELFAQVMLVAAKAEKYLSISHSGNSSLAATGVCVVKIFLSARFFESCSKVRPEPAVTRPLDGQERRRGLRSYARPMDCIRARAACGRRPRPKRFPASRAIKVGPIRGAPLNFYRTPNWDRYLNQADKAERVPHGFPISPVKRFDQEILHPP